MILIFLLGFLACGPGFIQQPERIYIKTDTSVRSGPGMEYDVIGNIKAGRELFLLESENDWHKVELPDGKTGWIFRGITNNVAREKIITIRDARVRRGPGEEYSAFAMVKKGKTLDSRGMRGNWFIVDLTDGNSGWISKKDAEKTSYRNLTVTESAKIYRYPNSNSSFILNVKPGTELIQLDKKNNYYMVRLPGGDTGWIHQKYVNIIKERTILVKTRAYIRTGPEIGYDTIATVDVGVRLTLLSQRENWYEIRTPRGDVGWIHKDFISTTYSSSYGGTMIEEQPVYVLTNQECNIRQGYSTTYHVIKRVKKGTLLLKIGEKNNWLRIKMPNERIGWIREDLVEYSVNILLTNEKCNIRRGYSTDFRRIREVSKGTPLVKISSRKGWTRVHLVDGEIGWIKNNLFTPLDSLLFANQDCNVRKGPSTGYEKIARLTYGSPVTYSGKDSNWYKIKLPKSKKNGYIRDDLLNKTGNEYLTNERCNIRQGPSTAFRLIR